MKQVHYKDIKSWTHHFRFGPVSLKILSIIGREAAKLYRQRYNEEPNGFEEVIYGKTCWVKAYDIYNVEHQVLVMESIIVGLRWGIDHDYITKDRALKLVEKLRSNDYYDEVVIIVEDLLGDVEIQAKLEKDKLETAITWLRNRDPSQLYGFLASLRQGLLDFESGNKHSWQKNGIPFSPRQLECLYSIMEEEGFMPHLDNYCEEEAERKPRVFCGSGAAEVSSSAREAKTDTTDEVLEGEEFLSVYYQLSGE